MNKICVGLDLDYKKDIEEYFKIIEETKENAYCFKINPAFFMFDMNKIKKIAEYLNQRKIFWIYDGKVADVLHTNEKYAEFIYEHLKADGTTINPFLGIKSLSAFKKYPNKNNFLVCRTSNEGAELIQDNCYKTIYNIAKNFGFDLVIAANKDNLIEETIVSCPNSMILSPGIGAQGGKIKVKNDNIIYNISRTIINDTNPKEKIKEFL